MTSTFISDYQSRIASVLDRVLSEQTGAARLNEAMRYSTLAGGKRVRALLVYAAGKAAGADDTALDQVAASLECIHTYSLIHDDLPAMDDDALRRGVATCHIKYDEATAILAGDALLTLAFELVTDQNSNLSSAQVQKIVYKLAVSAGARGMVGGQMLDILATEKKLTREQLEAVHRGKTGALIEAAVYCGAACSASVSETTVSALQQYAQAIGLAFQVIDDVLDIESSTELLGKQSGADLKHDKSTFPALIGLNESKKLAENLYQQAMASLAMIGDNTEHLAEIANLIVNRNH